MQEAAARWVGMEGSKGSLGGSWRDELATGDVVVDDHQRKVEVYQPWQERTTAKTRSLLDVTRQ